MDLTPDETDDFEERAAILEFDAGMPRAEAEALALECIQRKREQKARLVKRPSDPSLSASLCTNCRHMRDASGETFGWALCECGCFRHPTYINTEH